MITNQIDAEIHITGAAMFLSLDDFLEINVDGNNVRCFVLQWIKNIPHSISSNKKVYYSQIIEPASDYGKASSHR